MCHRLSLQLNMDDMKIQLFRSRTDREVSECELFRALLQNTNQATTRARCQAENINTAYAMIAACRSRQDLLYKGH